MEAVSGMTCTGAYSNKAAVYEQCKFKHVPEWIESAKS